MLFTGWGPIVVVVFLVITFGAQRLLWSVTGEGRYFVHHPFVGLLVFAVAAVVVWFLGKFMNRKPLQVMELDQHGRKLVPKARHTIWFVPAEYWGPILFVLLTVIILLHRD
jgi:amino acid transporter